MKLFKNSLVAGTNMAGQNIKNIYIEVLDNGFPALHILTGENEEENLVRTSRIEYVFQTTEDTLLFITHSGSRYAIQFENEEDYRSSFSNQIVCYMNTIWSHLQFMDLGKKLLSSMK